VSLETIEGSTMGYQPTLPMPPESFDESGVAITDVVWRHFSPMLADAREGFRRRLDEEVDPVLREAVRLRNARNLDCDY
jgi:hypothetical protein